MQNQYDFSKGAFPMHGEVIIGGKLPLDLGDFYPHFKGEPIPYFGCFTTEDGMRGMLFLDDKQDLSWESEGASNAAMLEGRPMPDWVDYQAPEETPAVFEDGHEVELEFSEEPHWLQGDETPEGDSEFLFEVPSSVDPSLNIGDGYGTVYVFDTEHGGRILWQS